MQGRAHVLGDNITTDDIIAGKYKHTTIDEAELSRHLMENIDPSFVERVKRGDFLVGGNNFGCGSSREQAPRIIRHVGISAVIAKSFARIFFRNAINMGLLLVTCDTTFIEDGDLVRYEPNKGELSIPDRGLEYLVAPLPEEVARIVEAGGLLELVRAQGRL